MRILHVTDFHFREVWFDWLTGQAGRYDAVCFTGDFLNLFSRDPGVRAQSRWVRNWIRGWPGSTPLFLCTGNHDGWPHGDDFIDTDADGGWLRKTRRPGEVWADGLQSHVLDGYRLLCVPWGHAPKTNDREPVIALVHAPPVGTAVASELLNDDAGGAPEVFRAASALPEGSVLLCGHVHHPMYWFSGVRSSNGKTTWAFNPGVAQSTSSVPNHIVLDTTKRTARAHGWNDAEMEFPALTAG